MRLSPTYKGKIKKTVKSVAVPDISQSVGSVVSLARDFTSLRDTLVVSVEEKLNEVDSKVELLETVLEEVKSIKKGDPGEDADEQKIADWVLSQIPTPKDGENPDPEDVIREVLSRLPAVPNKEDIVAEVVKRIPTPTASLKIIKEELNLDKDALVEEIINSPKLKLKKSNIDGLEMSLKDLDRRYVHGGGDTVAAGTNITITRNSNGDKVINASGGGGSIDLQTNGVSNASQTVLNLIEGNNMTLTADGAGGVTLDVSGLETVYVPYTGATANVDIGSNAFISTAGLYFDPSATSYINNSGGTVTVSSPTNTAAFAVTAAGSASATFDVSAMMSSRVFTFPDASGTLALTSDIPSLSGYIQGSGTTNEISYFTGSGTIGSLTTATYPSLTELSYVKGVTSAIQTQLNTKGTFTLPALTNGSVLFSNGTTIAQDNANFFWDDTNNRLGIGTASPSTDLHISKSAAGATSRIDTNSTTALAVITMSEPSVTGGSANIYYSPSGGAGTNILSVPNSSGFQVGTGASGGFYFNTRNTSATINFATGGNALSNVRMVIGNAGALKLNAYGSGTFTGTATKNLAVDASGNVIEVATGGGTGDVTGPASSTDNAIARFDGTTGKIIQNSAVTVADTTGDMTAGTYNGNTISSGTTSGTNTGDQTITLTGAVTGSGTGSFATTIATPGTLTVVSTNSTATAHTHAITSSSAPGAAASILATDASGIIGSTGTRIVKGWFTDLAVTNAIAGSITGNAATATALATPRTIGTLTGDVTTAGSSFDGSANNTNATVLATVNSNVGSFGSATQVATFTVNAKGLTTAASNVTITPAIGSITGLGTGVATALAVNVGSAGAPVTFNGALGTPSSGTVTNLTGTASININGTVGATTPSTGVFTTLVAGSTTSLLLGTAGSAVGNIGFRNATSGTATVAPPTGALGTYTVTLPNAASTLPIFGQQITFAGPTAARTVTLPDAAFTVARSDAAQTFTGTQTFSQVVTTNNAITATANAATVPITSRISTVTNNSAATLTITITTTSAVDGQMVMVRVLDFSAVAQTLTLVNTENSTVTAPATTNGSTTLPLTLGFQFNANTTKWRLIASA